jgi:hypothetical protein
MVNLSELLINVVMRERSKRLTDLSQKGEGLDYLLSGQVTLT